MWFALDAANCVALAPEINCPTYYVKQNEAIRLANKVIRYNETRPEYNKLLYSTPADLLETCNLAVTHETGNIDRYSLIAIWVKESHLNHMALNKRDGGRGIAQVMPRYWKEELPWYNNPYDKGQSTKASAAVLNILYDQHKSTNLAIKRYNGSGPKSTGYLLDVKRIRTKLLNA